MEQSFQDFEIIVSDNHATGVEDALAATPDNRIRHIRTPRRLPAHESWEFGIERAQGDWILLLCDDDAILPCLLDEIYEIVRSSDRAEIVTWRHASFVSRDFPDSTRRGRIDVPQFTGEIIPQNNSETLHDLFSLGGPNLDFARVKRRQPYPTHSAYKREVVSKIRQRAGALFLPTTPDYAAVTSALLLCPQTLVLDKPLTVLNSTADSNAAAAAGNAETANNTYAEFSHEPFQFVPFKGRLCNRNVIVDTILGMKAVYGQDLERYSLDLIAYIKFMYLGLDQLRRQAGHTDDFAKEDASFRAFVAAQSNDIILEFRRFAVEVDAATTDSMRARPLATLMRVWTDLSDALILRTRLGTSAFAKRRVKARGISTSADLARISDILDFSKRLNPLVAG